MQLDDRISGLEKKLARTTSILYAVVAAAVVLLGANLYKIMQKDASFERIVVTDSITIGGQPQSMRLESSTLRITSEEYGDASLSPGLLEINQTRLTGNELSLSAGQTQLVAKVSETEGNLRIANDSGIFSVVLGAPAGEGALTLQGVQNESISAIVGKGEAQIGVSNAKSTKILTP